MTDHMTSPRVVCAALRKGNRLVCGPRHYDPVMRQQIEASEGDRFWKGADQGFVDQYGQFLTREEARKIAWDASQVRRRCGGDDKQLFSENLY